MDGPVIRSDSGKLRRRPQQERSRERIELILAITSKLLAEKGLDGTTMKEISVEAKCTIAALYQYFDSKTSIIEELVRRHFKAGRIGMVNQLSAVSTPQEALAAAFATLDACLERRSKNTLTQSILDAANAIPTTAALTHAELEYLASKFAHATGAFVDEGIRERYYIDVLLLYISGNAVLGSLAKMGREDGRHILEQLRNNIEGVYQLYLTRSAGRLATVSFDTNTIASDHAPLCAERLDGVQSRSSMGGLSDENRQLRQIVLELSLKNLELRGKL